MSASPHSYTLTERDDDRWIVAIGDLIKTRIRLSEMSDLYPMTYPHLKGSEDGIRRAEGVLGFDLDAQHRTLLLSFNGWPDIGIDGDFLSVEELGASALWARGQESLDLLYEEVEGPLPPRDRVYPFCLSPYQNDVFVIDRGSGLSFQGHRVIWLANGVIQEWPNLYRWLLSMNEYALQTLAELSVDPGR